jgi:hypothetical protein
VAVHLRAVFANDGEEVADVIARHYLDALGAVPDDPDTAVIRGQAIDMLIRAGERAERAGAPAQAAASYATAAELSTDTATTNADWAAAIEHAGRARAYYLDRGQVRAAARARAPQGTRCTCGAG